MDIGSVDWILSRYFMILGTILLLFLEKRESQKGGFRKSSYK